MRSSMRIHFLRVQLLSSASKFASAAAFRLRPGSIAFQASCSSLQNCSGSSSWALPKAKLDAKNAGPKTSLGLRIPSPPRRTGKHGSSQWRSGIVGPECRLLCRGQMWQSFLQATPLFKRQRAQQSVDTTSAKACPQQKKLRIGRQSATRSSSPAAPIFRRHRPCPSQ